MGERAAAGARETERGRREDKAGMRQTLFSLRHPFHIFKQRLNFMGNGDGGERAVHFGSANGNFVLLSFDILILRDDHR